MTMLKPRSRTISVRLSEEEYLALRRVCALTGARSVSDLTREAILTREAMRAFLTDVNREDLRGGHLDEFRADIRNLEKRIEELETRITRSRQKDAQ
jgi:hypothetical protein